MTSRLTLPKCGFKCCAETTTDAEAATREETKSLSRSVQSGQAPQVSRRCSHYVFIAEISLDNAASHPAKALNSVITPDVKPAPRP